LIVWLALVSGGCVSPETPVDARTPWVPPRAQAGGGDPVWRDLRARTPDLSKPLKLADAADIALRNHPATRKAWNDACAAAAQVRQAQGYFVPTVSASASAGHFVTAANPAEYDSEFTKYGAGLQINYLVFSFGGGRSAAVEAALQTVYAADYSFNRSIQDVLLGVESAYYGAISAQAAMDAVEANVKDARAVLDAATASRNSGVGTELDVLQAQARHDQSLYGRASAQGQLMIARGALAQAMGLPADVAVQVVKPEQDSPAAMGEADVRRVIDSALARRPDIAALRATVAAKDALVKVAGSSLWPSLYLNGGLAREDFDRQTGKPAQDGDWVYNAGIALQWTLFDGQQAENARRAAACQAESARAQLQQAELAASADVWSKFRNYETTLQKCAFSAAFLKSSTASRELAMEGYQAGLKTILDLLTAEAQLSQARLQYVASRQETFLALAQLAHATGLLGRDSMEPAPATMFNTDRRDK
jgi:TolC family type I secretion outer membrane protein